MNKTVLVVGILIAISVIGILIVGLGQDPQRIESPLVGRTAPSFALRDVATGQPVSLEQFRGRPVVLNFWATWCLPCYDEHPVLVANARRLGSQVQFIGVVFQDTEDKILRFLNDRGSAYPTLVDDAGKTAIAYGVGGIPETFFLDASGTVVGKHNGPITTDQLQSNIVKAARR